MRKQQMYVPTFVPKFRGRLTRIRLCYLYKTEEIMCGDKFFKVFE